MSIRIDEIAHVIGEHFQRQGNLPDLRRFVARTLEGERGLLVSLDAGLVTVDEVVDALIDRSAVHVFGDPVDVSGYDAEALDQLRRQLRMRLRGAHGAAM